MTLRCVWCHIALIYNGKTFVHMNTQSMYVCIHGKNPRECCGIDSHCALPYRSRT